MHVYACMRVLWKRRLCLIVLALGVVVAGGAPIAAAAADHSAPAPLVFRPMFRPVGAGGFFLTSGRFVFLFQSGPNSGLVVDEATGTSTQVSRPGCYPDSMGGPWLLFRCGETGLALYRLAARQWRALNITHAAQLVCPLQFCGDTAVGSDWIRLSGQECNPDTPGPTCLPPSAAFQNIDTRRVKRNPVRAGGRVIADLSSPKLRRDLCSPLRVPGVFDLGSQSAIPGRIDLQGGFAVVTSTPIPDYGETPIRSFLERCGSKLHRQIPLTAVIGRHAVLWQKDTRSLAGWFLPSLRRFTIVIPAKARGPFYSIVIDGQRLYVQPEGTGQVSSEVWQAVLPAAPSG